MIRSTASRTSTQTGIALRSLRQSCVQQTEGWIQRRSRSTWMRVNPSQTLAIATTTSVNMNVNMNYSISIHNNRHMNRQVTNHQILPSDQSVRYETSASISSIFSWDQDQEDVPAFLKDKSLRAKEAWLDDALHSDPHSVSPTALCHILEGLKDCAKDDAAAPRRAERWIIRSRDLGVLPTSECYQAVVDAWANSDQETASVVVNRAERWLHECIRFADNEIDDTLRQKVEPNIGLYHAFLNACTKGRGGGRDKNQQALVSKHARKAAALLHELQSKYQQEGENARIVPTTESFNYVIRGWTRCKREPSVAKRVMDLLRIMESHQRENPLNSPIRPDTKSYAMAMDALVNVAKYKANEALEMGHGRFTPDPLVNGLNEMKEAREILEYMHKLNEVGLDYIIPNKVCYNIMITGWSALAGFNHHNAPLEAERVLREMISKKEAGSVEIMPDTISYEKVMLAWANSRHENRGKRAIWLLKRLWHQSEVESDKTLLPSNKTYNIAIQALIQSEGPEAAENLLLELGEKFHREQNANLCPNSESFSLVIRGWLRRAENHPTLTSRLQALQRAVEWLKSLRAVERERNVSTAPELFVKVIKAARLSTSPELVAYHIARETLDDLKTTRYQIDSRSFVFMLQTTLSSLAHIHIDEYRSDFVTDLIEECCTEGLISGQFVRAIATSKVYPEGWTCEERRAVVARFFSEWPLPAAWTRNIKPGKQLPQPQDSKM